MMWLIVFLIAFHSYVVDSAPIDNHLDNQKMPEKFPFNDPIQEMPGEPLSPSDFESAGKLTITFETISHGNGAEQIDGIFEGDIVGVLPRDATDSAGKKKTPKLHNAVMDSELLWPSAVIPYVISASFDKEERIKIARAILEFQNKTCLRFVPRSRHHQDYLNIISSNGCWSLVGRKGGEQQTSLGYGCSHVGIIMHELMHAVGFWHEQSRTDRDDHILIHWTNIKPGMESNFQKAERIQHLETPYDTGSIMHYDAFAFARNPTLPTITAKKKTTHRLGQRDGFSDIDVMKLNRLYRCNTTDKNSPTESPVKANSSSCTDEHKYCLIWMKMGECEKNPWMAVHCRQACNQCDECVDNNANCTRWAQTGECHKNRDYMKIYCSKSCGYCDGELTGLVERTDCVDDDRFCRQWASQGQCDINPKFMRQHCRQSCVEC